MAVEISQGVCDLCGAPSDASLQECNWLTCTYQHCEGGLYHQECLEKYLKSNKLEKNRKTGFKCPRGCGKGTRFDQACPGRIDKSHPIHPRNEDKKKTKLAAVVVEPQRQTKPAVPTTQNGKAAKAKEESKADAGKEAKGAATAKPLSVATPASAAAASAAAVGPKAVRKEAAALPPRPEVVAKQKLLAAQARRELGLPTPSTSLASHGSKGDLQVLAGVSGGPSKSVSAPSVWGKPSGPTPEPTAISPQPTMMSQLPQFQQLLQQAAGKKQAAKTTTVAAAGTATQAASKPLPAVPQPVTPPTPVWPALGTSQTSAAALLSGASGTSVQTSREATPRPGSPVPAWGSTAAAATAAASQTQQSAQQASASSSFAAASAAAPARPQPGAGSGASMSPAATAPSGTAASTASGLASSGSSPLLLASARASAAGGSTGQEAAPAAGTSGAASGRTSALDVPACSAGPSTSVAGPASPGLSGATARAGSQLVGADFADDEAKELKLTKAQKKNLKRAEKKKSPASACADQQQRPGEGAARDVSEEPLRVSLDGGCGAAPGGGDGEARRSAGGAAATSSSLQADVHATSGTGRGGRAGGSSNGARHQRHTSQGSDYPESTHIAEAEEAVVMEELCINCIVARKVLALITQLQRLGALEFVAAAAVQRHGSDVLSALEWLLVAGADAATSPADAVLAAAAESASAAESEIDISEELQQLRDLQAAMGIPTDLLHQCVVDCSGDVQTAANTAMERMLAAPSAGTSAATAAGGGGAGAMRAAIMRVSSSSGSMLTATGPGNGPAMRGSASFYSVSSLDGAVSVPDSEAAVAQQQQQQPKPPQQQQQQQQQARSSHFGVRLQDEPAGCTAASSSGGYGVGDAITAGFLRGGVVLGAAGWLNGYLREAAAPPPGFGTGAATAGVPAAPAARAGGGGGRSTSRLLHWLRDDSGRAAALEEEQNSDLAGGVGGLGAFTSDSILDSPVAAHGSGHGSSAGPRGESDVSSPSLAYWLSSNGSHPESVGRGAGTATAAAAGGTHNPYSVGSSEVSHGNFSFISALSKPPSMASQGGVVEGLGGYGSRWVSLGAPEGAQRGGAAASLLLGGVAAASEPEPVAHSDGDELSSIMALINVR